MQRVLRRQAVDPYIAFFTFFFLKISKKKTKKLQADSKVYNVHRKIYKGVFVFSIYNLSTPTASFNKYFPSYRCTTHVHVGGQLAASYNVTMSATLK